MDVLWGACTLVFAFVAFRAVQGAETTGGRVAGLLFGGVISLVCGYFWIDLSQTGAEVPILLQAFQPGEVRAACEAKGWRVADA